MAEEKSPRKLSLIASKGSLDMAYPPLILANAARMSGIETNVFFYILGTGHHYQNQDGPFECGYGGKPQYASFFPHSHLDWQHSGNVGNGIVDDAQGN